jgi:phage gp29-like protein
VARRPSVFERAAAGFLAAVKTFRGPEESKVADIPGIPHYGKVTGDDQTRAALESLGVFTSRVAPLAGPTRTRFSIWPADGLTPEVIVGAQRDAVTSGIPLRWVELIDQIYSRDGHYAAVTNQRVEDCIKGTWRLTRSAADDAGTAMRNFVAEAYGQCSRWRDGLGWLLYSNLYGYNAVEVEWEETEITFPGPKGETIGPVAVFLPKRLHNVHPKHFRFDIESDDPLFWIGNGFQRLPPGKFIFMDGDGLHPIKVRRGHAWQCCWYSLFRSAGWASWAVHVDRFSLPLPVIEYDGDVAQYNEYKNAYEDILNSLGQGKGVILPKSGASIDIKDPPGGGTSSDPASALSDACDAGQSIRVLGATLTAKIGNVGSFAASETHADVKYAKEENDVGRLWERIDEQLTAPLIAFNAQALAAALNAAGYSVDPNLLMRRVPRGKHRVPRESDPMQEAQTVSVLVNELGLPLSQEGMLDRIDVPRAASEEDRIRGRAESVSKGGALMTAADAAKPGGALNPDTPAETKAKADAASAAHVIATSSSPSGDGNDE